MTFYNRNGILYYSINGKRKSTKLEYSKQNIKKFKSYFKDDEFFNKFNVNKKVSKVIDLCSLILEEKEKDLKLNSYLSYLSLYNSFIVPYFKDKLVTDITPLDIHTFYKTFKGFSSLNTCNTILRQAFEKSILLGEIKTTPFIIKKPKLRSNYKINPFTFDEAKTIVLNAPYLIKNLLATLFYTGMRTGECLGLKWSNIDFENFTIKIDSQFTASRETSPKTQSSIRIIDMIPQCELYLLEQYKITNHSKYVFLNTNGKPFKNSNLLTPRWKKLLNSLNIEYRSIYQTRHSFASNMLSNNESYMWVSQMLGHNTPNTTLNTYSKYIKVSNKRKRTYLDN